MKNLFLSLLVASTLILSGCSNATQSAINAWRKPHIVEMYSGGSLVGYWETTGKVLNEKNSDGYFFQDAKTGKMVTVSGDIVITVK